MLTYVDSVVLPAFLDESLRRPGRKGASYFFHNTAVGEFTHAGQPRVAVYGRLVYTTVLRRTQIYDTEAGLIQDNEEIDSAPSAFFVLILDNHKLIYANETPYAPPLEQFARTTQLFLNRKHSEFLQAQQRAEGDGAVPVAPRLPQVLYEAPSVEIVPLSSTASINDFLLQYEVLKQVQFDVLQTNQEIQAEQLWRGLEERRSRIHAAKTTVTHKNTTGLDKEEAATQIAEAAATGNQHVRLSGKDHDGNTLKGDNENLRLSVNLPNPPEHPAARAETLINKYDQLTDKGILRTDGSTAVPLVTRLREFLKS